MPTRKNPEWRSQKTTLGEVDLLWVETPALEQSISRLLSRASFFSTTPSRLQQIGFNRRQFWTLGGQGV